MCNFSSLLFLSLLLLHHFFIVESKTYWEDVEALKEFKNSVDPNSVTPGSCLSSWDFTLDPCDTIFGEKFTCGFRCDDSGRVVELGLDQASYSGQLDSLSWNLPFLQSLDLTGNNFSGSVPGSFVNLTGLTRLALSQNSFTGPIPDSIGFLSSLEELFLDGNNLQGPIPASFNGLVSLKRLEMQSNKISGEVPDLSSLKNLLYLDVSDNSISGRIPETLPGYLIQISMRNNKLENTIPQNLKFLNSLQVLDVSHNSLTGAVPSFLFTHPSLQQLSLSFNEFTSLQPLDYSTVSQSQIVAVDLSDNTINGYLPLFMGLLPRLSALNLENNRFTGTIPTLYALKVVLPGGLVSVVSPFERLLLGGNYLFGLIPGRLMSLKPGSANVRLVGNCLYRCPTAFFFCQGGDQKSLGDCRRFSSNIP